MQNNHVLVKGKFLSVLSSWPSLSPRCLSLKLASVLRMKEQSLCKTLLTWFISWNDQLHGTFHFLEILCVSCKSTCNPGNSAAILGCAIIRWATEDFQLHSSPWKSHRAWNQRPRNCYYSSDQHQTRLWGEQARKMDCNPNLLYYCLTWESNHWLEDQSF